MGLTTARKLASDLNRTAQLLEKAGTVSVEAGASLLTARLKAAGAAHGPLHGKKGRPIRLSAKYKVRATGDGGTAYVKPSPAGAWVIADQGAGAHLIGKATSRGRRKGRVTYLVGKGYDHPVRGPIIHEGARGSRAWRNARDRAQPAVLHAMEDAPLKAVRSTFGR